MVNQNFINLLAEGKPEYTDGGVLAEFTWLIVVLPFLAAILITFLGKYLPLQGAELALGTVLFIFSYSAALLYEHATKGIANEFFINVGSIGSYDLEFGWVVDGLSIMMYFVVGTVSSLVFIYRENNQLIEAESILSEWVSRNPSDGNAKKILEEVRSGG